MMPDACNNIPGATRVVLNQDREAIEALEESLLGAVEREGYSKSSRFAIRLAFEEGVMNAFHHGHRGLDEGVDITVDYAVGPERVWIAIEDQGPGFDPNKVPDPRLDENLDKPSGRGLMLIRSYMTEVGHNDRGNRLTMCYQRAAKG